MPISIADLHGSLTKASAVVAGEKAVLNWSCYKEKRDLIFCARLSKLTH